MKKTGQGSAIPEPNTGDMGLCKCDAKPEDTGIALADAKAEPKEDKIE